MSLLRNGFLNQKGSSGTTVLIPSDNVSWVNIVGDMSTGIGTISPNSDLGGWNKSGGFGSIPANTSGELEFNPLYILANNSQNYGHFGLSDSSADGNEQIIYDIYLRQNEYKVYTAGNTLLATFSGYLETDLFTIERLIVSGVSTVYFKKNGSTFYTSTINNTSELFFCSAVWKNVGAKNIKIKY